MTDDHLSKRQQARIEANAADRLAPWLRDARAAAGANPDAGIPGLVVSHLRREVEVAPLGAAEGDENLRVRCFLRATVPPVVSGDRILFEADAADPARGVITARLPRLSLLSRHTPKGLRPVCANLDLLLITVAPEPAPHADLIDRYLVAATLDDLEAVLVFNKCDLETAADGAALRALYDRIGIDTYAVSAGTGEGLDALRARLDGRTAAFVGQSGVGKSSLINALIPGAGAETGDLSGRQNRGRSRGRHTTSTTRLYHTDAGVIIDSPGIREFAADIPDEAALVAGMPEIAEAAAHCRFRDCHHESEPDCAVHAGLEDGSIERSRFASFRALRAEITERAGGR
ncbi:MAG TPA: ribosome small subunit-dependent GTPase A [Pseudomonadales bacterium]|nr:ribosome small subunit-dependent GTPase A [Pseudomonadales bacterium]